MDNVSLVTTALEYFDVNSEKYEGILKHAKYLKFISAKTDMENNTVCFFDKNKNEILRSRYEIIGLYSSNTNTWTWAWAIAFFKKNNTNIARKLWNYGAMLDPNTTYLKTELITSRFRVADFVQLDIHVGIASYISKNPFVYKYRVGKQIKNSEGEISIDENKIDQDGFISIDDNNYILIYYMFLLDHALIDPESINKSIENNRCTTKY
jgi:hypothetical protein